MHLHEAHRMVDEDVVAFGSFRLNRARRVLSKAGVPIAVRSRAMGILLALTETPGGIVSNRELLQRVWPNMIVENGTVRVHVSQLCAVLRKGTPRTNHGYRFVAPVIRQCRSPGAAVVHPFGPRKLPPRQPVRKHKVPQLITSVVGREQAISSLVLVRGSWLAWPVRRLQVCSGIDVVVWNMPRRCVRPFSGSNKERSQLALRARESARSTCIGRASAGAATRNRQQVHARRSGGVSSPSDSRAANQPYCRRQPAYRVSHSEYRESSPSAGLISLL